MIVTFLGTGTSQGIPVIACDCEICQSLDFRDKRTRTSVHIQHDDLSLVIDTGPDFRQQILRERIQKLNAVVYTHAHRDHTGGLDEVRSFNFKQKQDMPVYGSEMVINQIKSDYSYIFSEPNYPGLPRVQTNIITEKPFTIDGLKIIPINLLHYKLPVFGFRIKDFTYITDANFISDEDLEKVHGSKVLVLNALQIEPHISHFNLKEALEIIERIRPERAYLTHISHRLGLTTSVEADLPENVSLAYDGLKIEL